MSTLEWIPLVSRRESPLWVSLVCAGGRAEWFQRALGWTYAIENYKYEADTHQIAVPDAIRLQQILDSESDMGEFFTSYLAKCAKSCTELEAVARYIRTEVSANNSHWTRERAGQFLVQFFSAVQAAMPFLASLVLVQDRLEGALRRGAARVTGHAPQSPEVTKLLSQCVVPAADASVVREARNTLRLAALLEENGIRHLPSASNIQQSVSQLDQRVPGFASALEKHIDDYGWLRTFTYLGEPFSVEEMLARIEAHLERGRCAEQLRTSEANAASERQEAVAHIHDTFGDNSTAALFRLAGEYLYWRFERVDVHFRSEFMVRQLERVICNLLGYDRESLVHCTFQELERWLAGECSVPATHNELRMRREVGFACYVRDGNFSIAAFPSARQTRVEIPEEFEWPLRGTTACSGTAAGTARIVLSSMSMHRLQKGNILVTTMTTPDLMLAIERCAGIVTDEGGLLCHAAIISRELRIPCVIGTQFATQVLSDGSAVALDARRTEGLVQLTGIGETTNER